MLKVLGESARKFEAQFVLRTIESEESDSMRFGSLVHCLALTPEVFRDEFAIIPEEVLTSNGQRRGKAWEAFAEENRGKYLMKQIEVIRAELIVAKIRNHAFYQLILDWQRDIEDPIYWTDEETGVECKGIPDIVCRNEWVIDLKTTSDLTGFVQGREKITSAKVAEFGYHMQGAFYLEGASEFYGEKKSRFALIVVETKEPYRVYAIEIDEPSLFAGRMRMRALLEEYARRLANNDWAEEGELNLLQVSVPGWAM